MSLEYEPSSEPLHISDLVHRAEGRVDGLGQFGRGRAAGRRWPDRAEEEPVVVEAAPFQRVPSKLVNYLTINLKDLGCGSRVSGCGFRGSAFGFRVSV